MTDPLRLIKRLPPRYDPLLIFSLAGLAYFFYGLAWPLQPGRDFASYMTYYLDLWRPGGALSGETLFRTPGTPLFMGLTFDYLGAGALEWILGGMYALAILAWWRCLRDYGRRFAFIVTALIILYPPYGALFHSAASASLFAAGFAFWLVGIVRTKPSTGARFFLLHGVAVGLLCLIRPSSQVLLIFALFPLLCFGTLSWRSRFWRSGIFVATTGAILLSYASYNLYRNGEFVISRPTAPHLPFYRLFVKARLIKPTNGPVSAELARQVQKHLLTSELYRSHNIDVKKFFSSGDVYMWADLAGLHDHVYGWESRYNRLFAASREALQRYPVAYLKNVIVDLGRLYLIHGYLLKQVPHRSGAEGYATREELLAGKAKFIKRDFTGQDLGHHLIPHALDSYLNHRPGGIEMSAEDHRIIRRDLLAFSYNKLPTRDGSAVLAWGFNAWTLLYPQMGLFLLVGVGGLLLRRPEGAGVYLFLLLLAGTLIVITFASVQIVYALRVPFDPLCLIVAAIGLFARSQPKLRAAESVAAQATEE